ncbi:EF-hand domain-containing protein [Azohydromonas aeria]|uniref:EF-hand domain-containing protein n=1 Tax=Azohydromonas aeria TaxID=2590212 RepID=UPI0012F8EC22|nr:EF-hand domain-containing protein [Azohydromonas aeria]
MKSLLALAALSLTTSLALAADPQLTDAQVEPAFAKADANKNGTVDLAEAKKFGIAEKAFHKANPDKDGSLDKQEFAAAIVAQFVAANPDNDGTLDEKEARNAGIKSKSVFEAANPDKDGTLDIAEYLVALTATAK